ncbi:MAG: RNA 2',3'-cyclic phosphodiesterase [Bacteroidales bacterium]|nr:RNA 2',3'-cyclic phosphodiesterase [Bacteroidales bacterium]
MSKRLFLAIPIKPNSQLLRQRRFLMSNLTEEKINWVKEDKLHLTLKFIGKTQAKQIPEIIKAIKNCVKNFNSFQMSLERIGIFGSNYHARVVWVGIGENEQLRALQGSIVQELETIGFNGDRQNFVPHFTLGRIKKIRNKDHFKRVMERTEKGFIQEVKVDDFVLLESVLTAEGPIYKTIERFMLRTV